MKSTFLGHQSWLIESKDQKILVDPLLNEIFGQSGSKYYAKESHHEINAAEIDAVLITCVYFQHFDLDSLLKLNQGTKIYLSEFTPPYIFADLINAGLTPVLVSPNKKCDLGDFEFLYVTPSGDCVPWDARVCSLILAAKDTGEWGFFQSDTKINEQVEDLIPRSWKVKPSYVTMTNNRHYFKNDGYDIWDNIIGGNEDNNTDSVSLDVLLNICPLDIYPLNIASNYFIVGGQYKRIGLEYPEPRFNNETLAEKLDVLVLNSMVYAPLAGTFLDNGKFTQVESRKFLDIYENKNVQEYSLDLNEERLFNEAVVDLFLDEMAKSILLNKIGTQLIFTNEYGGSKVSEYRFVVVIVNGPDSYHYALSFTKSTFVKLPMLDNSFQFLERYPSGCFISFNAIEDFIYSGASMPELLTGNFAHWYLGGLEFSPLGLIYKIFSEYSRTRQITKANSNSNSNSNAKFKSINCHRLSPSEILRRVSIVKKTPRPESQHLMSSTDMAIVWHDPKKREVHKLHSIESHYNSEKLAYELLKGAPIPELLNNCDDELRITMSHIEGQHQELSDKIISIITSIAETHIVGLLNIKSMGLDTIEDTVEGLGEYISKCNSKGINTSIQFCMTDTTCDNYIFQGKGKAAIRIDLAGISLGAPYLLDMVPLVTDFKLNNAETYLAIRHYHEAILRKIDIAEDKELVDYFPKNQSDAVELFDSILSF